MTSYHVEGNDQPSAWWSDNQAPVQSLTICLCHTLREDTVSFMTDAPHWEGHLLSIY